MPLLKPIAVILVLFSFVFTTGCATLNPSVNASHHAQKNLYSNGPDDEEEAESHHYGVALAAILIVLVGVAAYVGGGLALAAAVKSVSTHYSH